MAAVKYLSILLVVALMAQSSYQLRCHSCIAPNKEKRTSITIPGAGQVIVPTNSCPETFSKDGPFLTCNSNEVCLKFNSGTGFVRTCGPAATCQLFDSCDTCNTDGCNGASSLSIAMFVLALPTLIWKLLA